MKQSTFARKVLTALLADGWTFKQVDFGEGNLRVRTVDDVMKFFEESFELRIQVQKGKKFSFLYFVWQGSDQEILCGEEVLSDYGMSLDYIISPLYKEVEGNSRRPERPRRTLPARLWPR